MTQSNSECGLSVVFLCLLQSPALSHCFLLDGTSCFLLQPAAHGSAFPRLGETCASVSEGTVRAPGVSRGAFTSRAITAPSRAYHALLMCSPLNLCLVCLHNWIPFLPRGSSHPQWEPFTLPDESCLAISPIVTGTFQSPSNLR